MLWQRLIPQVLTISVLAMATPVTAAPKSPVLTDVRAIASTDTTMFEIKADGPLHYSAYLMPQLWKGVVDLPNTKPGQLQPEQTVSAGPVNRVLIQNKEINGVPVLRVAFDLSREEDMTVRPDAGNSGRLVVVFRPKAVKQAGELNAAEHAAKVATVTPIAVPQEQHAMTTAPLQPIVASPTVASTISDVRIEGNRLKVIANGSLPDAQVFALKQPPRLVIDLGGVSSSIPGRFIHVKHRDIKEIRQGMFQGKVRIVFDLTDETIPDYRVEKGNTGMQILLSRRPQTKAHARRH